MTDLLGDLRLVWLQVRYQNTLFWRSPVAAFFTIGFPLMFLVLLTAVFGNDPIDDLGITTGQFYAPAMAVFGAVSATYTNLAIRTAIARDEGILKRVRGTPLPPWVYLAGQVGSAVWLAAIAVVLLLVIGVLAYDVRLFAVALPSIVLTFLVGVACFAALGLLVAAAAPSSDATPAIANATLLPLAFISGIFFAAGPEEPAVVKAISGIFPLRPFAQTFQDAFDPQAVGASGGWLAQLHWGELAVITAWLVLAAAAAARRFTWEPRTGERRTRRTAGRPSD